MPRPLLAAALFTLFAGVPAASAQPSPERGTVFIGAAGFAAVEMEPETTGLEGATDAGGTVAGGLLSVGVHLTPRVSARFEWGLTGQLETSQSYNILAALDRPSFDVLGGIETFLSYGTADLAAIVPANYRQERQTMTGAALLGYHLGDGRVSLEVLGGLGFVNQEIKTRYDVRILFGGPTSISERSYTTSTYHAVGVVGADVAVALTDHAAVVPSLRVFSLNNGLSVRPGVGLRWTF